jgi:hypothetical protein
MKKSGLQKKIAFIFDGADSTPNNTISPAVSPAVQSFVPSPTAELSTVNCSISTTAAVCNPAGLRPQPVCKPALVKNTITPKQAINIVKSRFFQNKSKNNSNKQQKKMTLLVAVLAAVFVGVLIFSFGSTPSTAVAADSSKTQAAPASEIPSENTGVNTWKTPEPYPATLRDPMKFSAVRTSTGSETTSSLLVRGIVYTETRPTAIVSGQIVCQGDIIAGVKVTKITKDFVEFEKDGKHWKQQVER